MQEAEATELKPVFAEDGVSYVSVQHNNLYLLALTRKNSNVMVMLVFLEKLVEIMNEYFGSLEEESIRDNFVLVYELLDEVMDHGYPQIAEAKVLKEYITQGAYKLQVAKPPQAVTNVVSWRTEGIKHKKNEVFLDVVESLNLLVAANGAVLFSEILGSVRMRSFLSGMPELKLGLNDKALFEAEGRSEGMRKKAVEMEDIKFHQCVRLTRFETDRTISFIPPDGEFELMSYRLNTTVKPLIALETVIEMQGRSRLQIVVKAKSQFKKGSHANNVEVLIPVPPDVDSPAFQANTGTVAYVPDLDCIKWTIRSLSGGRDALLRATFGLPSVGGDEATALKWRKRAAKVKFEIPYFTVSGINVRYLKIIEKSGYDALPWCVARPRARALAFSRASRRPPLTAHPFFFLQGALHHAKRTPVRVPHFVALGVRPVILGEGGWGTEGGHACRPSPLLSLYFCPTFSTEKHNC
jgi:AP-1 complex subunit mu